MKKAFVLLFLFSLQISVLAQSIPPVSDPHCAYCNVNLRTATSHKSGCPYYVAPSSTSSEASSSSGGKSSSRSSSSTVDPALSAAVQSLGTALGAYIGEAFDRASTNYYAGSDHHYRGARPGDENGKLVVGRNGRHGNVGVFSNDTRLWKLPPIYKDVNIASLGTTFVTNRKDKVGVMDLQGRRRKTLHPFDYDAYKILYVGANGSSVYALARMEGDGLLWTIWHDNSRLISDEFDSVSVTQDGIVAIRGDRYQLFGFDGRLKTIVVEPQTQRVQ